MVRKLVPNMLRSRRVFEASRKRKALKKFRASSGELKENEAGADSDLTSADARDQSLNAQPRASKPNTVQLRLRKSSGECFKVKASLKSCQKLLDGELLRLPKSGLCLNKPYCV